MAKHKVKSEYPKYMFGPNGKGKIFNSPEEIPAGWVDSLQKLQEVPQTPADVVSAPVKPIKTVSEDVSIGDLSKEEMFAYLDSKPMTEVWAMAKQIGVEKKGKKPEVIERIIQKIQEAQEQYLY